MGIVKRLMARGYQPEPIGPYPVRCLIQDSSGKHVQLELDHVASSLGTGYLNGIGIVLPTYVSRSSLADNLATTGALFSQLESVRHMYPELPLVFFVGMQWQVGQEQEAASRLQAISEQAAHISGIQFVGISLPKVGKSRTLNAAFKMGTQLRLQGVGWVDDDVRLAPNCLQHLIKRFLDKGARGSVGATKIAQARRFVSSQFLHRAKQIMKTPTRAYPHGCCMLIDATLVARGIPDRYTCEDDFFCFVLLKPDQPNPFIDLELVPDAVCSHTVGGPPKEIYKRIRRSLFSSHIYRADFPDAVGSFYLSRMQFNGLWPLSPLDTSKGMRYALKKWLLKAVYFVWFLEVGAELFIRGLVGQPLKEVAWSAYSEYEIPVVSDGDTERHSLQTSPQ